jgi:hypothetical protein
LYWYLKAFPIKEISNIVDYIVYMTYDIHGQWDAGSKWENSGCATVVFVLSQTITSKEDFTAGLGFGSLQARDAMFWKTFNAMTPEIYLFMSILSVSGT